MFCPECGTQNEENAIFCGNCGTRLADAGVPPLTQNLQQNRTQPELKKTLSKSSKIILVEAGILLLTFIAAFIIYKAQFSPESVAAKYMEGISEQDWNAVYNTLSLDGESGNFLTKEAFVTTQTINHNADASRMKLKSTRKTSGSWKSATVKVKYRENGINENKILSLTREGLRWKVEDEELLALSNMIRVPSGATVSIDKFPVTDKITKTQDGDYDIYDLGAMFAGMHYVEVSKAGMEDITQLCYLTVDGITPDSEDAGMSVSTIQQNYNEETMSEVAAQALEDYKTLLNAGAGNKRASDVELLNGMYKEQKDRSIESYERMRDSAFDYDEGDDSSFKLLKLTNSEQKVQTIQEHGESLISVIISSDYYQQIHYETRYYSDDRDNDGECSSTLQYIKQDDNWLLYNAELLQNTYWW